MNVTGYLKEVFDSLKEKPCEILEVNGRLGDDSLWFAENFLSHPNSRLTCCVDWNEGGEEEDKKVFQSNRARIEKKQQVYFAEGNYNTTLRLQPAVYDLVYVHPMTTGANLLDVWVHVRRLVSRDGYVLFALSDSESCSEALRIIVRLWKHQIQVFFYPNRVLIRMKR